MRFKQINYTRSKKENFASGIFLNKKFGFKSVLNINKE